MFIKKKKKTTFSFFTRFLNWYYSLRDSCSLFVTSSINRDTSRSPNKKKQKCLHFAFHYLNSQPSPFSRVRDSTWTLFNSQTRRHEALLEWLPDPKSCNCWAFRAPLAASPAQSFRPTGPCLAFHVLRMSFLYFAMIYSSVNLVLIWFL